MHMRMVAFIVVRRKPFEVSHRNMKRIGQLLCLSADHIPPAFTAVEAQPFRILPAQREDRRPHISFMQIQFLRNFIELHPHTVICEQAVGAEPLCAGPGGDIVRIGFGGEQIVSIIFYGTENKLRGISHIGFGLIVGILKKRCAVREIF